MILKILRRILKLHKKVTRFIRYRYTFLITSLNNGELTLSRSVILDSPLICNGKGNVKIEANVIIGYEKAPIIGSGKVLVQARSQSAEIVIKSGTKISNNVSIIANSKIYIGTNCLIGDLVAIWDSDFHEKNHKKRGHGAIGKVCDVTIKDNVWIGSRSVIGKGVTIGQNSIVAAGSVVTKDIPSNVIVGGVPAKVISNIVQ